MSTGKAPFLLSSLLIHGVVWAFIGVERRQTELTKQVSVKINVVYPDADLVLKKVTPLKSPPAESLVASKKSSSEPRPERARSPVVRPKPKQTSHKTPAQLVETNAEPRLVSTPQLDVVTSSQRLEVERHIASYSDALRQFILKHRQYPTMARRLKQQGTVEVEFIVFADGAIGEAKLKQSSGYALIDEASLQMLAELKSFRPLPEGLASRTFVVPIHYRLR